MAMNYTDEEYHQMTIEECFQKEVTPNLLGVSIVFAEARKQMTLAEYKAFTLALSHHDWTKECPDILYMDKDELIKTLGIKTDIDHESYDLMRAIGEMPTHSFLRFSDKDKDIYVNGCFVVTVASFRKRVRIRLNSDYLRLFGCLDGKERRYITMWSGDIFKMNSERAVLFYELLRANSDSRLSINTGTVSIRKFKEMFDIPEKGKGSYTRNDEKHHFNRSEFEKRVIDPLCDELQKTEMITLVLSPSGKYYEKEKKGNRVIAYRFWWTLSNPKKQIEEKALKESPEETIIEERELWESTLDEFKFSREELDAIGARLRLIPQSCMFANGVAHGSMEFDRYHFMDLIAKDIKVEDKKNHIRNKYKYLIKILENHLEEIKDIMEKPTETRELP